jgi:prepilin-type N-terminal cleavage/methylation domain-containing protein
MSFNNIKAKLQAQKGFTIVELLIVIVVIGILAAITIVAYNGVTARANTTSAQASAVTVTKKAEAYNADGPTGLYPLTLAALTGAASTTSYAIPSTSISLNTTVYSAAPASPSVILFYTCGSGAGVKVGYWNYTTSAAVSTATTYTAGVTTGTCTLATT